MKLTPDEERIEDKLDLLEDKLRKIWDDDGFVVGTEADLNYEEEKIDHMLKFLDLNPNIDSDEVIFESMSVADGEDVRNYNHPDFKDRKVKDVDNGDPNRYARFRKE